ncbi:MAG TPA: hypothetical protein VNL18_00520 [Gemmatimonadales bacterium]|nr:hypothetical protein [Gemmatimonadales bacterium]
MRRLLCLTLIVAGCAREAPRAPANPADRYAGTWDGVSFRAGSDSGISWTSQMAATAEGTVTGTLTFSGMEAAPIELRTIELSDSMIVFEMGPYESPTARAEVITRSTGRVVGDSLWGTFEMLPTAGGGVAPDMSVAQWSNAVVNPKPGSEPIRGTFAAKRRSGAP